MWRWPEETVFSNTDLNVVRIYQLFYFGIFNKHVLLRKFTWSKWNIFFFGHVSTSVFVCWYIHNNDCMHIHFLNTHFSLFLVTFWRVLFVNGTKRFSNKLLMSHLSSIIRYIVYLYFSSGVFPAYCKSAIISPFIKKKRRSG